jgi:hypothetical protein
LKLPESAQAHAPITIVEEPPLPTARPPRLRGDTLVLRTGVLAGIRYDFPPHGLADIVTSPEEVLAAPAQVDEMHREGQDAARFLFFRVLQLPRLVKKPDEINENRLDTIPLVRQLECYLIYAQPGTPRSFVWAR